MALLRQYLHAVRALRGDQSPPALHSRPDLRLVSTAEGFPRSYLRPSSGDEALDDTAANSFRRNLPVATPRGRAR
jgi:hypothetical protein